MGNFVLRITTIERFDPNQGRGFRRPPAVITRTGGRAVGGDLISKWQACEFVNRFPLGVPNLHVARKSKVRIEIGKRAVNFSDKNVIAVRSDVDRAKDSWCAYGTNLSVCTIYDCQLSSSVILKQVLVVWRL